VDVSLAYRQLSELFTMPGALHHNPLSIYQRFLQSFLLRVRPAPLASLFKRMLGPRSMIVVTPNGRFRVDPISILGRDLTEHGSYEPAMQKTLEKFLAPGATFLDVGANVGYFTIIGAQLCGPSGRVLAIEPQERLLPMIKENIRINGVAWATVLNVAVTDVPGTVTLHLTADMAPGGSGLFRQTKYHLPTQQAIARTLTQILNEEGIDHVDLMKVDIEGSEYEALLGSPDIFRERIIQALALELHPTILQGRNKDVAKITKMLAEFGYIMSEPFGNAVWLAPG
jgi:FkbM family methyltransferase